MPNKLLGVVMMFGSILILFVLPWLDTSKVRSATFRPIYKWFVFVLLADCVILGVVGANKPEGIYVTIGRLATFYYFFHFLILIPFLGWFERPRPLPTSIGTAVLKGGGRLSGAGAPMEKP